MSPVTPGSRRLVLRLIVCIVLGALASVAVAWGLAWHQPELHTVAEARTQVSYDEATRVHVSWWAARHEGAGTTMYDSVWQRFYDEAPYLEGFDHPRTLLPDMLEIRTMSPGMASSNADYFGRRFVMHGWPFRALAFTVDNGPLGPNIRTPPTYSMAVTVGTRSKGPVWLPLSPLWPGFAVNTALYAGALVPLSAVPGALRRRRRIRRGLCPECKYPVGMREVCTECGANVAAK